jgi:S1-C subfamily serine protease
MRAGTFIVAAFLAGILSSFAQEKIVQTFDNSKEMTTPLFTISDKWEIRWTGASALTLTLVDADGSIVAGTTASTDGSLYVAKGGTFYLQIAGTPAAGTGSWHVTAVELGAAPSGSAAATTAYVPPTQVPPPSAAPAPAVAVAATATTASNTPQAAPSTVSADTAKLSDAEARAIVLIKGDVGEGTGFLTHGPGGVPVVITNIHVISANPHLKVTTSDGRDIPILAYKGAVDRDIAMLTIKDDHYSYLTLASDVDHLVDEGDEVLTPGNSEGGEVFLDTKGDVRGVGPEKIEFSNPIYHGNSGGPVLLASSGQVIAVVEGAMRVRPTDGLDRASLTTSGSAIAGAYRYFGLRLDNVPMWETYDLNRFLAETDFLEQFHRESRCLDSLMNGLRYVQANMAVGDADDEYPTPQFYQTDARLNTAMVNFHQQVTDADRMDANRELYSDVNDVAAGGVDEIRKPDNFYGFDRQLAKQELAYRQLLQKELEASSDRLDQFGY